MTSGPGCWRRDTWIWGNAGDGTAGALTLWWAVCSSVRHSSVADIKIRLCFPNTFLASHIEQNNKLRAYWTEKASGSRVWDFIFPTLAKFDVRLSFKLLCSSVVNKPKQGRRRKNIPLEAFGNRWPLWLKRGLCCIPSLSGVFWLFQVIRFRKSLLLGYN